MIKGIYLTVLLSLVYMGSTEAQNIWYENISNTNNISFSNASKGTFTTNETNPETTTINVNATVSKFVRDGQNNPIVYFNLANPLTDLSSQTISLKAYTSIQTTDLNTQNKRIRLYLRNSTIGGSSNVFVQLGFSEGETWESFSFDLSGITMPADVASAGGYNKIFIGLATGDNTGLTSTYYLDTISGSSVQTPIVNAAFLSGSWGVRFNVNGGIRLDNTDHYNWVGGAQQIADNLPAVGHVITNFTHPAHGYYYTLRDNPYVDVANEIHPAMVPTLANEQIILNAITILKNSGKKVILYLNGGGPGYLQGNSAEELEILAAWGDYYNLNYGGDEALAWRTLAKGYVERFEELGVDGYWIDNLSNLPGEVSEFVAMIREVDPDVAIATNLTKSYLEDENGANILVDSDGTNDTDSTDYKVFLLEANDPYMDFTAGHPTPLGQGAPPNSWAYEEFSFPLITENPWSSYDGSKHTLKHYFCPIREKWSVASADLVFEVEQAYRFVRTFTDAGAAITWSTTITDGMISSDEMPIMQEINDRMLQSPKPDYIPYVRPEGAYLVGETPCNWNGATSSDWADGANWSTGVVPTSSDIVHINGAFTNEPSIANNSDAAAKSVSIASGNTLTIDETSSLTVSRNFTNIGVVTLNSTENDFSSLIVLGTATGNIVYNRYVNSYDTNPDGGGWDLIGAPVDMTIEDFITANADKIKVLGNDFAFSQYNNELGQWVRYQTETQTGSFLAGQGYSMATNAGDGATVAFTGPMQTTSQSINIIDNNDANQGAGRRWNLVSNPFPSYIKGNTAAGATNFIGANTAVIDGDFGAVYGWNGSSYDMYNLLDDAFSIAPGQGFWVAALNTVDTPLNFTPDMRTTTGTGDFVAGPVPLTYHVALELYNGETQKATTDFYFRDGLSLGIDPWYDAGAYNQSTKLSTRLPQGTYQTAFARNAMGMDAMQNTRVPLEIRQNAGQAFRVSMAVMDLPEDIYVYLEDTLNGTLTSLKEGDFELTAQSDLSGADRFFIVFKSNSVLSNGDTLGINALNVFKANNNNFVTIAGITPELEKLDITLYSILGVAVKQTVLNTTTATQTISTDGFASGLYIVQLRSGNQVFIKKIIVE